MKIRGSMFGKMILFSGVIQLILLFIVCFALFSFYQNDKKQKLVTMEKLLMECSSLRLELLVRRDSSFTSIYNNNLLKIHDNLKSYDRIASGLSNIEQIKFLDSLKEIYQNLLTDYDVLFKKFGMNEDSGIEGDFRNKIHLLEAFLQKNNNEKILFFLLQARRREKDFMLRGREEYSNQVHILIKKVILEVQNSDYSNENKNEFIELASDYDKSFGEFVEITKSMSSLEKRMYEIESKIKTKINYIVESETEVIDSLQATLIPLFIFSVILSFIFSVIIAKSITKPLVNLKEATIRVATGDLSHRVNIKTKDEIGDLANFFNLMTDNISKANETILKQQNKLHEQFTELKEINATRDKFFSIIAHDLKNPISAFMGVSAFLVKTFQDLSREEIKDFLDDVNATAKQLYELLENLLLWSRTQRGLIQYHPMKLELKSIIEHNIGLLKINADNKNIELIDKTNDELQVFADPNMLNTILRNLISNAIKFTDENGRVIVCTEIMGKFCCFSVIDNGVGIPESNMNNLFKLESSITTVGTRQESGTGLGLIICKEFIEFHHGKIWIESKMGIGSKFHFTIPLVV